MKKLFPRIVVICSAAQDTELNRLDCQFQSENCLPFQFCRMSLFLVDPKLSNCIVRLSRSLGRTRPLPTRANFGQHFVCFRPPRVSTSTSGWTARARRPSPARTSPRIAIAASILALTPGRREHHRFGLDRDRVRLGTEKSRRASRLAASLRHRSRHTRYLAFRSRASFCASTICAGVILFATRSRFLRALSPISVDEAEYDVDGAE
jgi:hypothetical protein